jgi:hypothetical protein
LSTPSSTENVIAWFIEAEAQHQEGNEDTWPNVEVWPVYTWGVYHDYPEGYILPDGRFRQRDGAVFDSHAGWKRAKHKAANSKSA